MKKILIIGGGEMQIPVIQKCNEMGFQTIVTDGFNFAPGLKIANIPLNIDTLDKVKTLEIAEEFKIDAIITTSDFPVNNVAFVANKLGLPGLSPLAAEVSTNKYLQREILKKNHYKTPSFIKTKKLNEVKDELLKFNLPLIVKPVDSSASRGVTKIINFFDLENAFNEAVKVSKSGDIIIEEFIEGKEYSVESLTQNGITYVIAITEKYIIDDPNYFVEERHIIPAELNIEQREIIVNYVTEIISLFDINNSGTHTEIKLSNNECTLIELGARLGGDFIASDLVPLSTGVDMLKNIILIAMNQNIEINNVNSKYSGIQFIHKNNYMSALKFSEIENFVVRKEIKNFNNAAIKSSMDRLGYFIIQDSSRENLLKKLNFEL